MNTCLDEIEEEGHQFEIPYLESGRASYRYSKYPRCEICGTRNSQDDPARFRKTESEFRDQMKSAAPGMRPYVDSEFTDDDFVCVHCHSGIMQAAPFGECEIRSCRKQRTTIVQAAGYVWATYVDRVSRSKLKMEIEYQEWMCNGCWSKIRMCHAPYAPLDHVAPEPESIATPDDSPRSAADAAPSASSAVAEGQIGSAVADQDMLGCSVNTNTSNTSTKSAKVQMVYISADQSSAACIYASPDGDGEEFSQAPNLKDEKEPGTCWKLPFDESDCARLTEDFKRLRESVRQIPSSSSSENNDDQPPIPEVHHAGDKPTTSGQPGENEPWSVENPNGLTDSSAGFVRYASTNIRTFAKNLIEYIQQWGPTMRAEAKPNIEFLRAHIGRNNIYDQPSDAQETIHLNVDNDGVDYDADVTTYCHVCSVPGNVSPDVHGERYVQMF